MKTKITVENEKLNNLIEHSVKLSLLKLLLKNNEIDDKEYYKLREAIKNVESKVSAQ